MSGKAKIESLTNTWYGYAVFSAALSLLSNGIGFFSLLARGTWLAFALFGVFMIGRSLTKKSALVRAILICITSVMSVMGAVATGKMALSLMQSFELSTLATTAISAASVYMMGKSLKTLLDPQVKAYIG